MVIDLCIPVLWSVEPAAVDEPTSATLGTVQTAVNLITMVVPAAMIAYNAASAMRCTSSARARHAGTAVVAAGKSESLPLRGGVV